MDEVPQPLVDATARVLIAGDVPTEPVLRAAAALLGLDPLPAPLDAAIVNVARTFEELDRDEPS